MCPSETMRHEGTIVGHDGTILIGHDIKDIVGQI